MNTPATKVTTQWRISSVAAAPRTPQRWNEKAGPPAGCDKLPMKRTRSAERRPAMKKSNTCRQSSGRQRKSVAESVTIGMDLGDKMSRCCTLNSSGEVVVLEDTATTKQGMTQAFGTRKRSRIAMEVGTHSPWVSRL